METTLSTLKSFPETRSQVETFKNKLKDEILNGSHDLLIIFKQFKILEKIVSESLKDKEIKEAFQDAVDKYSEKTIEYNDFEIMKSERKSYDFSDCGDPVYNLLQTQIKDLKEQIKVREAMLKTGINQDTGEVYKEPVITNTKVLSLKLK